MQDSAAVFVDFNEGTVAMRQGAADEGASNYSAGCLGRIRSRGTARNAVKWVLLDQRERVADTEGFTEFGRGNAGVGGETIKMVEARCRRPGRELRAA